MLKSPNRTTGVEGGEEEVKLIKKVRKGSRRVVENNEEEATRGGDFNSMKQREGREQEGQKRAGRKRSEVLFPHPVQRGEESRTGPRKLQALPDRLQVWLKMFSIEYVLN